MEIYHAGNIVSYVKNAADDVMQFATHEEIDFMGCSEYYVEEKINALIFELQQLERHLKMVEKMQRRSPTPQR